MATFSPGDHLTVTFTTPKGEGGITGKFKAIDANGFFVVARENTPEVWAIPMQNIVSVQIV
jgi:hypothetical protein